MENLFGDEKVIFVDTSSSATLAMKQNLPQAFPAKQVSMI